MHQTNLCNWILKGALALAVVAGGVDSAFAGWGHGGGSSGGSSGGWGSSGGYSGGWGSSGGYGSSGGTARRGLFHHHHRARYGGSSGGWGSNGGNGGGSSGGWGSSGGYGWSGGSSGGYGSNGGGWGSSGGAVMGGGYYAPGGGVIVNEGEVPLETAPMNPPPLPEGEGTDPGVPGPDGASLRRGDGTLVVEVPAEAKIYVNDRLTTTPGAIREYVSRNLVRGYNYTYEVRAEVERDGKTVTETKKIDLRAGQNIKLAFNLSPAAADEVETSITVKVPANAKVNLGGNDTNAKGETRTYRTSALRNGTEWKDYKIVVTAEIDGREISKEQTFDLKAGEDKELNFDFDAASIADAR